MITVLAVVQTHTNETTYEACPITAIGTTGTVNTTREMTHASTAANRFNGQPSAHVFGRRSSERRNITPIALDTPVVEKVLKDLYQCSISHQHLISAYATRSCDKSLRTMDTANDARVNLEDSQVVCPHVAHEYC
jgi:hypothetical protein